MIVNCVLWCRGNDTGADPTAGSRQAQSQEAGRKRTDIAFLVAQLGAYAAERFGERAAALDFTRPQAGLLRLISREPGRASRRSPAGSAPRRAGWSRWWTAWSSAA